METPHVLYFNHCLIYDPLTGILKWRPRHRDQFVSDDLYKAWNARWAGRVAGANRPDKRRPLGRCCVMVLFNGKRVGAHRVIWEMVHGEGSLGTSSPDHINLDPWDNRLQNLRLATKAQNQHNHPIYRNNTSGVKGVSWDSSCQQFDVRIGVNGKKVFVGKFRSIEEAATARRQAELLYHGDFSRTPGT